jgi:hypothetical protein
MKSPSELMKVWWPIAINILKRYCYFEFFIFNKYFLKANSRGNKIFPINNRFCDLYIKRILHRCSEFKTNIIKTQYYNRTCAMNFQLIKIIGEFYYILIRPLARIRISLLIFDLKIEIILKIFWTSAI